MSFDLTNNSHHFQENLAITESKYRMTHIDVKLVSSAPLTFFGMCKLSPSCDPSAMSSPDRKFQHYGYYPECFLEVKSSIIKRPTAELRFPLISLQTLNIFLLSQNTNGRDINAEARTEWWVTRQTREGRVK